MLKSFTILYLFFGTAETSSVTTIKFDTPRECQAALADAKLKFGFVETTWPAVSSENINGRLSRCVVTNYEDY